MRMKYLFLLGCSLAAASPAWAQDAAAEEPHPEGIILTHRVRDEFITVVATGRSEYVSNSGQSISVIGANEIKQVQGPDLTRVLERLPGVTLARTGGLGSQTSLFVRGANSEQVVVLLDGVRLADVAAPSGGFDLGTLLPGGIGKIELLRGSNSVPWGSDAIGGVLAVSSADFSGAAAGLEYGAHDTVSADLMLGQQGNNYAVSGYGGYVSSNGISAFAPGAEPDPFRQWRVGLRGRVHLNTALVATVSGRYADSRIDFDGYPFPTYAFADTPEFQTTRQASGRVGLAYDQTGFKLRGGVAISDTRRAYFDPTYGSAPGFETVGRSWRADLAGMASLNDNVSLDFGVDSEWTRFSTTFDPRNTARQTGGYGLLRLDRGPVKLTAGARLTDHDRFGSQWTLGSSASIEVGTNWRIKASFGEGFKAPTLSQLYGYGGNVALQPETSKAIDFGVELGGRGDGGEGMRHFAVTLFRRDSSNLIDYVSPTGYFNLGRTRAQGFEIEASAEPTDGLTVRAAYTFLDATNRTSGKQLARRPRHALSASADWTTPLGGLALGADLRLIGDSFDDAGNFVPIDGHAVLTLRASVPLGERLELYGRIENVGDEQYQTVSGYGTYGRSAYAGVRVKW
jgi:vitamin B12 transporter